METIGLIYHLVKEKGLTLPGARQRLKDNKEATVRNYEIVNRLKVLRKSFWLSRKNWTDDKLFLHPVHLFDVLNLLQIITDCLYIFHIVYP